QAHQIGTEDTATAIAETPLCVLWPQLDEHGREGLRLGVRIRHEVGAGLGAVARWQAAHGLVADGVIGPRTLAALRAPRDLAPSPSCSCSCARSRGSPSWWCCSCAARGAERGGGLLPRRAHRALRSAGRVARARRERAAGAAVSDHVRILHALATSDTGPR